MIGYSLFLFALTMLFIQFGDGGNKSLISILSVVLFILPLIGIIFSTTYFYNSMEFIQLLVSQPLKRSQILTGMYLGVACSLSTGFLVGTALPLMLFLPGETSISLSLSGLGLTCSFVSMAFFSSVTMKEKSRGIGFSLMLWFYFSVLYDAIILAILFSFSDYPMEKPVLILGLLNPVDLARISVLMKLDISAVMGLTGAVYKDFFGTQKGFLISQAIMALWVFIPLLAAGRSFRKKNL